MGKRRLVIDGDVLAYKAAVNAQERVEWDRESLITEWADVRRAKDYCNALIDRWCAVLEADSFDIGLSDPSGHYFRHDIYPAYKAGRKGNKPIAFHIMRAYLVEEHNAVWLAGLEGDDVVGLLCTEPNGDEKIIISIDKDLKQLPAKMWNCDSEKFVSDEQEDVWFHLEQTLTGDRVDGYPGCPGIGPVKARKMFEDAEFDQFIAWELIVDAFEAVGLGEKDALDQARLAYILRNGDYDSQEKEVQLWEPMTK